MVLNPLIELFLYLKRSSITRAASRCIAWRRPWSEQQPHRDRDCRAPRARFTDHPRHRWVGMHGPHSEADVEDTSIWSTSDAGAASRTRNWSRRSSRILAQPALRDRVSLTFDASGVGAAVEDLFNAARSHGELEQFPLGVVITAGGESRRWQVSKKDLISCLVVAFESGQVKVADGLPLAATLKSELLELGLGSTPRRMPLMRRARANTMTWYLR